MRETRLESVLELRRGGLPAPVAANLVARAAEALATRPRVLTVSELRIREDGAVKLVRRDGPAPFAYRAPEIVKGSDGDPRAAVFGLGVLLVHVALGRSPFERNNDLETRLAVSEDPLPSLADRAAKASAALDAIVQKACAKDAADRYESPAALRDALDGYLDDELHETGAGPLAAAVRDAVQAAPSDDRTSMPDYDDAQIQIAGQGHRAPGLTAPKSLDGEFERIHDPLSTSSGEFVGGGDLDIDGEVVARGEEARIAKTLAPIVPEGPDGPNWLLRIGVLLGVLLALSLVYRFVLRPLIE